MAKNFNLTEDLNLHYCNTFLRKFYKRTNKSNIIYFVEALKTSGGPKESRINYYELIEDKWTTAKYYLYRVEENDETKEFHKNRSTKLLLSYPVINGRKNCIESDNNVFILNKKAARQWLWGLCNNNTHIYNFILLKNESLSKQKSNLLKDIFFTKQKLTTTEKIDSILSGKKDISTINNEFVLKNNYNLLKRNGIYYPITLYYKKYKIGIIDDNLNVLIPNKLDYLGKKLAPIKEFNIVYV